MKNITLITVVVLAVAFAAFVKATHKMVEQNVTIGCQSNELVQIHSVASVLTSALITSSNKYEALGSEYLRQCDENTRLELELLSTYDRFGRGKSKATVNVFNDICGGLVLGTNSNYGFCWGVTRDGGVFILKKFKF